MVNIPTASSQWMSCYHSNTGTQLERNSYQEINLLTNQIPSLVFVTQVTVSL